MTWREEINHRLERIEDRQIKTLEAIAALRVKAGIWGAIAGVIPMLALALGWLVFR